MEQVDTISRVSRGQGFKSSSVFDSEAADYTMLVQVAILDI